MVARRRPQSACVFCGEITSKLPHHLLAHIQEKPFDCHVCKMEFSHEGNLRRHDQIHAQEKRFSCGICGKGFQQKQVLTQHMSVHSKVDPHRCPHCSFSTKHKSSLKVHLKGHNGEKEFKCWLCEKRFLTSGQRNRHLRTHTGERAYQCPGLECPKNFVDLRDAMDHLRCEHLGEKVHFCKICNKEFGHRTGLSRHRRNCNAHLHKFDNCPFINFFF